MQRYSIDFVYQGNGQAFGTYADLSEDEREQLFKVLRRYEEAGAIEQVEIYVPKPVIQGFEEVLDEIVSALEFEVSPIDEKSQCQNCCIVWPDRVLLEVEDLSMRVAPGEPMPSGECPSCGAVCHPVDKEQTAAPKLQFSLKKLDDLK